MIIPKRYQRGFSLLEMSIVLIIIALVTTMAATSGMAVISTARLNATISKMNAIDQALMSFRIANDRLPCPGDLTLTPGNSTTGTYYATTKGADYGLEAGADANSAIGIGTGVCAGTNMTPQANFTGRSSSYTALAAEGAVPTATLGLPSDFMYDGWGNRFNYAVDVSLTYQGIFAGTPIGAVCGPIEILDGNNNARSTGAIYALLSHGPNGHGAYTQNGVVVTANESNSQTHELTDCHCNPITGVNNGTYAATYIQAPASPAFPAFDDIVTYKERWQMQTAWDTQTTSSTVWVADSNGRVQRFTPSGAYMGQYSYYTTDIAFDKNGSMWMDQLNSYGVQKLNSCGAVQLSVGVSGGNSGQFSGAAGIAFDLSGNVWVADTFNYRIQEFSSSGVWIESIGGAGVCISGSCTLGSSNATTYTSAPSTPVGTGVLLCNNGSNSCNSTSSTPAGIFGVVYGIAFDPSGNLWAADTRQIEEINTSTGAFTKAITTTSNCKSIAFDSNGNIWATCANDIEEYNTNGTLLMTIGGGGRCVSGTCTLNTYSTTATITGTPSLAPVNCYTNSSCSSGSGNYLFSSTYGIAVDSSNNIWVTDQNNNRVVEFNNSGTYIRQFGSTGTTDGKFNTPYGIAVSR